jgi:hypothetical protein
MRALTAASGGTGCDGDVCAESVWCMIMHRAWHFTRNEEFFHACEKCDREWRDVDGLMVMK